MNSTTMRMITTNASNTTRQKEGSRIRGRLSKVLPKLLSPKPRRGGAKKESRGTKVAAASEDVRSQPQSSKCSGKKSLLKSLQRRLSSKSKNAAYSKKRIDGQLLRSSLRSSTCTNATSRTVGCEHDDSTEEEMLIEFAGAGYFSRKNPASRPSSGILSIQEEPHEDMTDHSLSSTEKQNLQLPPKEEQSAVDGILGPFSSWTIDSKFRTPSSSSLSGSLSNSNSSFTERQSSWRNYNASSFSSLVSSTMAASTPRSASRSGSGRTLVTPSSARTRLSSSPSMSSMPSLSPIDTPLTVKSTLTSRGGAFNNFVKSLVASNSAEDSAEGETMLPIVPIIAQDNALRSEEQAIDIIPVRDDSEHTLHDDDLEWTETCDDGDDDQDCHQDEQGDHQEAAPACKWSSMTSDNVVGEEFDNDYTPPPNSFVSSVRSCPGRNSSFIEAPKHPRRRLSMDNSAAEPKKSRAKKVSRNYSSDCILMGVCPVAPKRPSRKRSMTMVTSEDQPALPKPAREPRCPSRRSSLSNSLGACSTTARSKSPPKVPQRRSSVDLSAAAAT